MGLTQFPNGISSFGIPVIGGSQIPVTTGTYFFVDDSGSNANDGLDPDHPVATIDYAIGLCTGGKSDVILVMPGHAETISSTTGIIPDVADISIIGLGEGGSRPTITYDTGATTIITITGARTKIKNIIFSANYADIAIGLDVDAVDCWIDNCSWRDTAGSMNWLTPIGTDDTANAADGLTVTNCDWYSPDAGVLAFVSILANIKRLRIQNNICIGASAANVAHFLIMSTFVCLGSIITDNMCIITGDNNAQTTGIFATSSSTTSTGVMARNFCGSLDTTTELFDDADNDFMHFENYYVGTIAKNGKLWPAADAT